MKNTILTIGSRRPAPCFFCEDDGMSGSESVGVCQWCEEGMCENHEAEEGMCERCAHTCTMCGMEIDGDIGRCGKC